jgi:cell division protein FtsL
MTTEERYELIYGNTARTAEAAPKPKTEKKKKKPQPKSQYVFEFEWRSIRTYAAVIVMVLMCISYVNLNAANTQLRQDIASLKTDLNDTQITNDDLEAEIYSGVDYESIRKTAISKLGMAKPKTSHIIKFSNTDEDYIRQYSSIPE